MRTETTIIEKCLKLIQKCFYTLQENQCDVLRGEVAGCELLYSALCNHINLNEIRSIDYNLMIEKLEELDKKQLDIILDVVESEHILVSKMPIFHILSLDDNNTLHNQMYSADILFHDDIYLWKLIVNRYKGYDWAEFNGNINRKFHFDSFFYGGETTAQEKHSYLVIYHMYNMNNKFLVRGKIINKFKKLYII
ncbi:MAG: hypothetical protein ACC656_06100 [Candidatus Heimdallarchaeota archaeon]